MSSLLWTFPVIMFASIVIGWAAEVTAVRLSAGMALAILAWLQTAPEFAVEASIAWRQDQHLALANLTGSLRLLMGLGWPVILFINWYKTKKRVVALSDNFSVEAVGLIIPVLYFFAIYLKGTWTPVDGGILVFFYGVYFWLLNLERKKGHKFDLATNVKPTAAENEEDEEPFIVRKIMTFPRWGQNLAMMGLFAFGGIALMKTVHPFVDSLKAAALSLGVSEFIFVQWIAPIASEFPEKVTAFNWARKPKKVPFAIVNMLSSVTSQWTLLAGLIPIVFSISAGRFYTLELTDFQRTEILLTIAQSALAGAILADLKIFQWEAVGLFFLWILQLVLPHHKEPIIVAYFSWTAIEMGRLFLRGEKIKPWCRLKDLIFS